MKLQNPDIMGHGENCVVNNVKPWREYKAKKTLSPGANIRLKKPGPVLGYERRFHLGKGVSLLLLHRYFELQQYSSSDGYRLNQVLRDGQLPFQRVVQRLGNAVKPGIFSRLHNAVLQCAFSDYPQQEIIASLKTLCPPN